MKKTVLLLFLLILSLTLLVGCNKTSLDDMIITPEEIEDNTSVVSENETLVEEVKEVVEKEVVEVVKEVEETKTTISLKNIDDYSVVVNDPLVGKPSYGPDESYEMNMMLSASKFPDLDHIVISFNPLCGKPSTIRVAVSGSLLAEEAFTCDEVHEVIVPKSVLEEGYNTILMQSKVRDDFYLDEVKITFHYAGKEPEVYPGDNFFFKVTDDDYDDMKTLQRLSDIALANVVTRTFRLDADELIEPIYLKFELSTDDANLILLLNDEAIPYDVKKGDVIVLLPKNLLEEGKNTLSFIALAD